MALARTLAAQSLPITPRWEAWLSNPKPYSDEALEFAQWALNGTRPQRERRLLRASGFGQCMRRRVFTWLGVPEDTKVSAELQNTFDTGSFMHLKWQMAGLTEGWLVAPEEDYPNYDEDNMSGARIDGVIYTGDLFEYKSCKDYDFKRVKREGRPLFDHVGQTHYAMINSGISTASIVYENKAESAWIEFTIRQSEYFTDVVDAELKAFNHARRNRQLPPILEGDDAKQCKRCPFVKTCPEPDITVAQWRKADTPFAKAPEKP